MEDKLMNNENCNQDKPSVFDYPVLGGLVTFWGVILILVIALGIPTAIVAYIYWLFGVRVGISQLIFGSLGTVIAIFLFGGVVGYSAWLYVSDLIKEIIKYRKDIKEWKQANKEKEL